MILSNGEINQGLKDHNQRIAGRSDHIVRSLVQVTFNRYIEGSIHRLEREGKAIQIAIKTLMTSPTH